mmetsp:Transcript_31052/g.70188  ORF Transcript_31052/g.70188 Transcript_31052/m.70188 type:complete len:209 (-) Transcript_31052:77-703(-)
MKLKIALLAVTLVETKAKCCNSSDGSCPSGTVPSGTVMSSDIMQACCEGTANNICGVSIGGDNPSCADFVATGCDEQGVSSPGASDTAVSSESSGGSETTADGDTSNSLGGTCTSDQMSAFPDCKSCIYKCGEEAEQCYETIIAGNCSPVCFSGGMTSCMIAQSDGGDNLFEDGTSAQSDGGTSGGYVGVPAAVGWGVSVLAALKLFG